MKSTFLTSQGALNLRTRFSLAFTTMVMVASVALAFGLNYFISEQIMIQLRQRFEEAAAAICKINLRRFLKEKEKS